MRRLAWVALCAALVPIRAAAQSESAAGPATPAPSPWVIGDTSPSVDSVVEAWFDRTIAPTPSPTHRVTLGSPSDLSVWLRTSEQSCRTTETHARRTTDQTDGPLLFVCARLRDTGSFRLVAASGAPRLIVSEPITVADAEWVSPAMSASLTTLVGFLAGLLTSYVQGLVQLKRDDEKVRQAVAKTLAEVLSPELIAIQARLKDVIAGGVPESLQVTAYNDAKALGPLAWGYLNSPAALHYLKKLDVLYGKDILAYQDAVIAWAAANGPDKPPARAAVQAEAVSLYDKIRSVQE